MKLASVPLLAHRIWRWFLDFWKICGPVTGYVVFVVLRLYGTCNDKLYSTGL